MSQEPGAAVSAWNSDDEPQADDWYSTDRGYLNLFAFGEAQLPVPPSTAEDDNMGVDIEPVPEVSSPALAQHPVVPQVIRAGSP